ncbi:heat-inducible transcription repressor HrcA [bacterium BMS3Abin05]|nr:heat-inducible transcription repressor HrcA [bacterium BMS3Abin05]GBE28496.1 heat-inducible transcription repressor HrcA [bacterium BMS3Bbin03]
MAEELKEREKQILRLVVHEFILTVNPVSSRSLARNYNPGYSPATIRNVMMNLEEKGFLQQPHVSAGRVPTNLGYRFYVDSLMKPERLTSREKKIIFEDLNIVNADMNRILERASKLLAKISKQLGVVLIPHFYAGIFEKLELVPISGNRTLMVLKLSSGLVKTIMMTLDFQISREKLNTTARILNQRLCGLKLGEIKQTIDQRLRNISGGRGNMIQFFIKQADELFNFDAWENVYYGGAQNIVHQPEFTSRRSLESLMTLLDNRRNIAQSLTKLADERKIVVKIGDENKDLNIQQCSLVTSSYYVGNVRGILGIIGPTRMQYSKIIPVVDYISQVLSRVLTN